MMNAQWRRKDLSPISRIENRNRRKMLTIKVRRLDGSEWVEEVSSVSLNTPNQSQSGRMSVTFFRNGKEPVSTEVYDGKIYVMNENGKTVANYDLGYFPPIETLDEVKKEASSN